VRATGTARDERERLDREALDLLARLLQTDTTNPPGNETQAALVLRDYFAGYGLAAELVGDLPDRQNLIVRLPGSRPGPRLGLLGHLDVVPAEASEWSVPPFSGVQRDGYLWGRGATDMKNQVAAQAVAVARLARAAVAELSASDPESAQLIEPLLGVTFSPTILQASDAVNVIPSHASVEVDCRILPGQSGDDVRREVDAALAGIDGWEFAWTDLTSGNESPAPTPLSAAIESVMAELVPGAEVVPLHLCGFTDSRWFREAFPRIVAYGFCPYVTEDTATMGGREHARDERIAVADVSFQARFFQRLVAEVLA